MQRGVVVRTIINGMKMGMSPSAIAAEIDIPRATVYRIKEHPAKAVALLKTWGLS